MPLDQAPVKLELIELTWSTAWPPAGCRLSDFGVYLAVKFLKPVETYQRYPYDFNSAW
ncbi:hypothetical protein BJX61DRAFT_540371 [Aspergillus egyptiacus]|nr:hypothetical protein BJX61DRAFT_540371 [Aspergillus egyptiacus]